MLTTLAGNDDSQLETTAAISHKKRCVQAGKSGPVPVSKRLKICHAREQETFHVSPCDGDGENDYSLKASLETTTGSPVPQEVPTVHVDYASSIEQENDIYAKELFDVMMQEGYILDTARNILEVLKKKCRSIQAPTLDTIDSWLFTKRSEMGYGTRRRVQYLKRTVLTDKSNPVAERRIVPSKRSSKRLS